MKKLRLVLDSLMDRFIDKMMDRFMTELIEQGKPDGEKEDDFVNLLIKDLDIKLKLRKARGTQLLNAGVHPMLHRSAGDDMDDEEKELAAEQYLQDARWLIIECSEEPKVLPGYKKAKAHQLSINDLDDSTVLGILGEICPFDNSNFYRANPSVVNFMDADCPEEHYLQAERQGEIAHSFAVIARMCGRPLNEVENMLHEEIVRAGEIVNSAVDEDKRRAKDKGEVGAKQ